MGLVAVEPESRFGKALAEAAAILKDDKGSQIERRQKAVRTLALHLPAESVKPGAITPILGGSGIVFGLTSPDGGYVNVMTDAGAVTCLRLLKFQEPGERMVNGEAIQFAGNDYVVVDVMELAVPLS